MNRPKEMRRIIIEMQGRRKGLFMWYATWGQPSDAMFPDGLWLRLQSLLAPLQFLLPASGDILTYNEAHVFGFSHPSSRRRRILLQDDTMGLASQQLIFII